MGGAVDLPLRCELRYGLELTRLVCDPAFWHPARQADAAPSPKPEHIAAE